MKKLHVAVGVMVKDNAVLVSLRKATAHMGGFWEFPGGKVESGEKVKAALCRELEEELGVKCTEVSPLYCYTHRYPDREVKLDVWRIDAFEGNPKGIEGQPIEWVAVDQLISLNMIPANRPIINALRLPIRYGISEEFNGAGLLESFVDRCLESINSAQLELFQLRCKNLSFEQLVELSEIFLVACKKVDCALIVNAEPKLFDFVDVDGVHLSQHSLTRLTPTMLDKRPRAKLLGISCHNAEEIHRANAAEADYISISPVLSTASHPDAIPMGWNTFKTLCQLSRSPAFALGGLSDAHLKQARALGAHGVAAIRGFCLQ